LGFSAGSGRETDETDANRTKLMQDLLDGQYDEPVRIVAFNTAEGWSRDMTEEIAAELALHAPVAARSAGQSRTSLPTTPSRAERADLNAKK
jgi:hypothetical protein